MSKVIIYQIDEEGVAVIYPTLRGLELAGYDYHILAKKDVPTGVPYKIVDTIEVPSDRIFRNAWEVDETEMTDGVGGHVDEPY